MPVRSNVNLECEKSCEMRGVLEIEILQFINRYFRFYIRVHSLFDFIISARIGLIWLTLKDAVLMLRFQGDTATTDSRRENWAMANLYALPAKSPKYCRKILPYTIPGSGGSSILQFFQLKK